MKAITWAVCGLALAGLGQTQAVAQDTPTPLEVVEERYQAAVSAYEGGDLTSAEAAARAALAAYEQVGPADSARAVLLINLAIVLVESGRGVEAGEPLAALAAVPSDSVARDAQVESLLAAHASFLRDPMGTHLAALAAAQAVAPGEGPASRRALRLAQDVALWSMGQRRYRVAEAAWRVMAAQSGASDLPAGLARGRALTGAGAALMLANASPEAYDALVDALDQLASFAGETDLSSLTIGQAAYAEALAWRAAARAQLGDRSVLREQAQIPAELSGAPARCPVRLRAEPLPEFPSRAVRSATPGAAVLRFSLNAQGSLTGTEVVSFVPDASFAAAVAAVAPRWRVERIGAPSEACRMERAGDLVTVVFRFD